jgi:hypothetical protein
MPTWKNDNENNATGNIIKITSDTKLDPTTITFTGTISLRASRPTAIKGSTIHKLFKLKQIHEKKS